MVMVSNVDGALGGWRLVRRDAGVGGAGAGGGGVRRLTETARPVSRPSEAAEMSSSAGEGNGGRGADAGPRRWLPHCAARPADVAVRRAEFDARQAEIDALEDGERWDGLA